MLCVSGFELYSRWVPLMYSHALPSITMHCHVLPCITMYCHVLLWCPNKRFAKAFWVNGWKKALHTLTIFASLNY